jgi:hypothetical protein
MKTPTRVNSTLNLSTGNPNFLGFRMIRNEIQKMPAHSANIFGTVNESKMKGRPIKEVTATVLNIMDKADNCHFGL